MNALTGYYLTYFYIELKSACQRTFSSSSFESKFLAVVNVYCDFFN